MTLPKSNVIDTTGRPRDLFQNVVAVPKFAKRIAMRPQLRKEDILNRRLAASDGGAGKLRQNFLFPLVGKHDVQVLLTLSK